MLYNVFAAEMALGITDANLEACREARAKDEDGIWHNADHARNTLLFLLLASCCQDYIKESGLAPESPLYQQIADRLARLTDFLSWNEFKVTSARYAEAIGKGVILADGSISSFAEENGVFELSKDTFDRLAGAFGNMVRDVFGMIAEGEPIDPKSLAGWVTLAFEGKKPRLPLGSGNGPAAASGPDIDL